jgi:hypothetical protein
MCDSSALCGSFWAELVASCRRGKECGWWTRVMADAHAWVPQGSAVAETNSFRGLIPRAAGNTWTSCCT